MAVWCRSSLSPPCCRLVFWSAWGAAAPGVWRATLGGDAARALAALKLVYPGALALDPAARLLYWADAYLETVERTDYEGGRRLTVRRSYVVSPRFFLYYYYYLTIIRTILHLID